MANADEPAAAEPSPDDRPSGGDAGGSGSVPSDLRYIAVAVAFLLMLAGVATMMTQARLFTFGSLFLCVGFGIMLAVFGANAKGTFANFNVVGGGAMAIVLYLLIYNFPIRSNELYARGRLENSADFEGIVGSARQLFLVGKPKKGADYEFVIFEKELQSPYIKLLFQRKEQASAESSEFYINCIKTAPFKKAMNDNEEVVFSLEPTGKGTYRLIDNENGTPVGSLGVQSCNPGTPASGPAGDAVGWLDMFSMSAFAQDAVPDLKSTYEGLESDNPVIREESRMAIADLKDPAAIGDIARSWVIAESSYRGDLGRLVAWTSQIERDPASTIAILNSLSPEQLRYLAQLMGQGDRTLRGYATEIFHRLLETTSWPEGPTAEKQMELLGIAKAVIGEPKQGTRRKEGVSYSPEINTYNMVVSVWFAECSLGKDLRTELLAAIQALDGGLDPKARPRTHQKSLAVIEKLKGCS